MKYLLDTNVLVELLKGNRTVRQNVASVGLDNCNISEITFAEMLYGAYKGGFERHSHEISFLKDNLMILPISQGLNAFAKLKSDLEMAGNRIDNFDLLKAATAITSNLVLVSHNVKHFERIQGLKVIDWELG